MTRAKPYTDAEIAERRENPLCVYVMGQEPRLEQNEQRWFATVDSLQARLAAAESECRAREEVQARLIRERNAAEAEAARARGLLLEIRERHAALGEDAEGPHPLVDRIDRHLASRPEGEVRDGR